MVTGKGYPDYATKFIINFKKIFKIFVVPIS
jgi:hypothetical protein